MADAVVVGLQPAAFDALSPSHAVSVTVADKVINTKTDNMKVEENKSKAELFKVLLTDSYCHVCEAVLCFDSQRVSHYEGKKHCQKLKLYLQAKRAEMNKDATGLKWTLITDKDHFCELCNMVFSSNVVAKSHYKGKVHLKNLQKQGLHPPVRRKVSSPNREVKKKRLLPKIPRQDDKKSSINPTPSPVPANSEVDLKDSNKYCALCVASFNSPLMAMQHYEGRKHQRNQTGQELLKHCRETEEDAKSLMCSMQLTSVEMFKAHMQGNKHPKWEMEGIDLGSSQKVYSSFSDELADYIQVQKARGITSKPGPVHSHGAPLQMDGGDQEDNRNQDYFSKGEVMEMTNHMFDLSSNHLQPSFPFYYPAEMRLSSLDAGSLPQHTWDYHSSSFLQCSGFHEFTNWPLKRTKHSSLCTTSPSLSDFSGSRSTNNEDFKFRQRQMSKLKRSRGDKCTGKVEGCDDSEKKTKCQTRSNYHDSKKTKIVLFNDERRVVFQKEGKQKQKKLHKKNLEVPTKPMPEVMRKKEDFELWNSKMNVRVYEGELSDPLKQTYRRERKKAKADDRTDEEKLWDDSILGC